MSSSKRKAPMEPKAPKSAKTPKAKDNTNVNSLTRGQITAVVTHWFTKKYKRDPRGKKGAEESRLEHATPFFLISPGEGAGVHMIANPFAFGWTKGFMLGYPTFHVKVDGATIDGLATRAPDAAGAGKWANRIPVHGILWRYYNGFATIPDDYQVSHLTDQPLLVTPTYLYLEMGHLNRSRTACHRENWISERYTCEGGVVRSRCPHWNKPCQPKVRLPSTDSFRDKNLEIRPGGASSVLPLEAYCVPL